MPDDAPVTSASGRAFDFVAMFVPSKEGRLCNGCTDWSLHELSYATEAHAHEVADPVRISSAERRRTGADLIAQASPIPDRVEPSSARSIRWQATFQVP